MRVVAIAILGSLLIAPSAPSAKDSVFRTQNMDRCETVAVVEDVSITIRCDDGPDTTPYFYKQADERQTYLFGPIGERYLREAFETFASFNVTTGDIEWRLDDGGHPTAAIVEFVVDGADRQDGLPQGPNWRHILTVFRVARESDGKSCAIAYVDMDANPDAREIARDAADETAQRFECGIDIAGYRGRRGPSSDEPMGMLPR